MSSFPENIKVYGLQSRSSATTAGLRSTALFKSWVQRSTPILNFELPIQCTRLALDFRANLGQKRRGEQMYTVKRMVGLVFQQRKKSRKNCGKLWVTHIQTRICLLSQGIVHK